MNGREGQLRLSGLAAEKDEPVRESPYATASFDGAGTGGGGAGVRFSDRRRHHERHPSRRFASLRASCGVLAAQTAVVVVILKALTAVRLCLHTDI
ncbi:unnamed protein product [Heligmosomoides polygyrus]|uniref:Uncharacterized protein n=1 Tax=Heligmosomoides polygyrus TaxID=6339 RepID=A0A183GKI2_HELPZ|nr:unnamed protein product [Heligmosomoides polygyrus]